MKNIQTYIERAISKNQLKLEEGERFWRKYYIRITELIWARNFEEGYQIELYEENKNHHIGSVLINRLSWERISKLG